MDMQEHRCNFSMKIAIDLRSILKSEYNRAKKPYTPQPLY